MTDDKLREIASFGGLVTGILAILAFVVSLALRGSILWLAIATALSVLGCSVVLWAESRAARYDP